MKLRPTLLTLALLTAFPSALAQLNQFKDWEKSAEFIYFATDDEKKAWKAISTDAQAEAFVNLFWAKRDPEIKTPVNEFRERIKILKAKADERFTLGKKPGSLSERGKALIIIGPPKSISERADPTVGGGSGDSQLGGVGSAMIYQFKYEQAQLPTWADMKSLDLTFRVDIGLGSEALLDPGKMRSIEKKAPMAYVKNPGLKEPPVYKTQEQIDKEIKAAQEAAAEAARGPQFSPAVRGVLEPLFTKEPFGQLALMSLAYRDAALNLMTQIHLPASALPATEGAKLVMLLKTKDGKDAARVEQAAVFQKTKTELFTDKSVPVTPGEYDVAAAILDAAGTPVFTARRTHSVPPLPTEFGSSELFIGYADLATEGSKPEDPFTFSQRKFVSRGDGKFEKTDGLSYVIRLYNPGIDPVTRKTNLKRSIKIKPKNGMAQDVPLPPEEPSVIADVKPGETVVVDMAGSIVDNNLGDYFKPGDLEFRLKITDSILNKTIEVMAPFTIVGPPPKAAPAPAAPPQKKK